MYKFFILAIIAVCFLSCENRTSKPSAETRKLEIKAQKPLPLHNRWVLKKIEDSLFSENDILNDPFVPRFTIDTTRNLMFGNLGCNGFSADLKIKENSFTVGELFHNEISCPSLPMEEKFLRSLIAADSFRIQKDELIIFSKKEKLILQHLKNLPFENKEWSLQKIDGRNLVDINELNILASNPVITFDSFRREAEITLGCEKKLTRNFRIQEQSLFIEPLPIFPRPSECDKKWGIPFLEDITDTVKYTITENVLTIYNKSGSTFEFRGVD